MWLQPRNHVHQFNSVDYWASNMPLQLSLTNLRGGQLPLYTPEELTVHVTGYRTRSKRHTGEPVRAQPGTLFAGVKYCMAVLSHAAVAAAGDRSAKPMYQRMPYVMVICFGRRAEFLTRAADGRLCGVGADASIGACMYQGPACGSRKTLCHAFMSNGSHELELWKSSCR